MTRVASRWVGARDTIVENVVRPFRPRPVPLLMAARGVGQPAGSDPGEGGSSVRSVDDVGCSTRKSGVGQRARGWRAPLPTPVASLRRERSNREQAEKYQQGDRGTVAVKRVHTLPSLGKGTEGRFSLYANGTRGRTVNLSAAGSAARGSCAAGRSAAAPGSPRSAAGPPAPRRGSSARAAVPWK